MSAPTTRAGRARTSARTLRTDRWWLPPLVTFVGLSLFVIYGLVRTFMNQWYWAPEYHYLAPFYSPCLSTSCVPGASHLFDVPLPGWFPPPIIVLPFVLGFRLTCYYYRKAYYRSFWASPPACAVTEPHSRYTGESRFPLILQNAHRYFFYPALLVAAVLTYDTVIAFHGVGGGVGVGLGTVLMLINAVLLWAYTLSCHSCRHLVGGRINHFSRHPVRYWMWTQVTKLNGRHMMLAWASLISVAVVDLYVMLVAGGVFPDLRLIN
ncbi:hypothetical protein FHX42_000402 [Saccharopolyspora lacisalsi]|uniref:Succinate dehydrogenase n=1 Tax=Halosaccharopolyspora lacisalsi TaxID=1000566 RepID=A0A839DPT1_9PSEU|nr:hypothetical protein [Halosaccharopolyspora lacisalsi]MBA8823073.1 hypothetical protein [Halosaccharopolyspora lacisalsi]